MNLRRLESKVLSFSEPVAADIKERMSQFSIAQPIPFPKAGLPILLLLFSAFFRPVPASGSVPGSTGASGFKTENLSGQLVCVSGRENHTGINGFIAKMDGKTYLVTSQSVLFGTKKLSFETLGGKPLRPMKVELSASRDIARLTLSEECGGLEISDRTSMGTAVFLPVANTPGPPPKKEGKIVGVGADRVEVSIPFTPEESGIPLFNASGQVIALVGYIQAPYLEQMKKGTRFGYAPRYFCHRMADCRWFPVAWRQYNNRYGAFYRKSKGFADGVESVISALEESPFKIIYHTENPEPLLASWIRSHNQIAEKHHATNKKKILAFELAKNIERLAGICCERHREIQTFLKKNRPSGFLEEDLETLAYRLNDMAQALNTIGNCAQDHR